MRLSDGTILMHAGVPYDPVKAHEYYIRNRHLKGRRKGSARPVPVRAHTRTVSRSANYTVKINNKEVTITGQQLEEQKAYAAKRVGEIKTRLNELHDKLKKLLDEAKKKKANANKKPTAADKSKSARKSKQYRQAHKQQLKDKAKAKRQKAPHKKTATHKDPVAELESKITKVKDRLRAAINIQRELASAKPTG